VLSHFLQFEAQAAETTHSIPCRSCIHYTRSTPNARDIRQEPCYPGRTGRCRCKCIGQTKTVVYMHV